MKKIDTYAQIEFGSNMDETYNNNWKPGGTIFGVSDRWGSKSETKWSDHMGR